MQVFDYFIIRNSLFDIRYSHFRCPHPGGILIPPALQVECSFSPARFGIGGIGTAHNKFMGDMEMSLAGFSKIGPKINFCRSFLNPGSLSEY
jgi:hypothetical protein